MGHFPNLHGLLQNLIQYHKVLLPYSSVNFIRAILVELHLENLFKCLHYQKILQSLPNKLKGETSLMGLGSR